MATFPVVAADQFGSAPLLVRSNPGFKTLALAAAGTCEPGDRFVLATDAVSARLLRSAASEPDPDWTCFEHITQDAWRAELDTLRQSNDMVNDDCTLVVLRVTGGEEPEEAVPDALPVTDESPVSEQDRAESPQGVDALRSPEQDDRVMSPAVADLMLDVPHDPPADESAERPRDEPPPADEPPAARDGFPESTDTRD